MSKLQRKFYMTESTADLLRIQAAKRNETQSEIVEKAVLAYLKGDNDMEIDFELTEYSDSSGLYEAIQLPWPQVKEILGRDHEGSPEDDNELVAALLASGAPEWVKDAEGWVDEYGWGIYGGPKISDGDE